jgi:hypothetical protein
MVIVFDSKPIDRVVRDHEKKTTGWEDSFPRNPGKQCEGSRACVYETDTNIYVFDGLRQNTIEPVND